MTLMHWSGFFTLITESFSDLVSLLCFCITDKPGVCPMSFLGKGLCKELCVNDVDCPNDEKCCSTKCGHESSTFIK
uniref:WAP domain-containing protein n=1 Tax=Cyprinus carpio TaxID=7962 RepID=A0A8C2EHT9_CYPCA